MPRPFGVGIKLPSGYTSLDWTLRMTYNQGMKSNYLATGALALGVILMGAGFTPTPDDSDRIPVRCEKTYQACADERMYAEAQKIIDEQTEALGASECAVWDWKHPKKGSEFIVKGYKFNRSVAWKMTVDEAWATNKDADKWNDIVILYVCK